MRTAEPSAPPSGRRAWRPLAIAALAVIAAVVLLTVLLTGRDATPGPAATGTTGSTQRPEAVSPERLAEVAASTGRPLFWVGRLPRTTYELTRTPDGASYVRYLGPGVRPGDRRPDFLTVATYRREGALDEVRQASERAGAQVEELRDGGLAVANRSRPSSWYLAFPDEEEVLVELFSPRRDRARELLRDGRVAPVEG